MPPFYSLYHSINIAKAAIPFYADFSIPFTQKEDKRYLNP
ncbi:hypothetical protein Bateq7PJ16_0778 [Bacillus subtilis]|nr:hypothetical protein Bateq7PJ16_0778 [Bacillus subtilis]